MADQQGEATAGRGGVAQDSTPLHQDLGRRSVPCDASTVHLCGHLPCIFAGIVGWRAGLASTLHLCHRFAPTGRHTECYIEPIRTERTGGYTYTAQYHTILYHTIPYHTIPYHTIPYHTIPYHTIPYHTIPYHTILYYTIPNYAILYHTRLIHTIPY